MEQKNIFIVGTALILAVGFVVGGYLVGRGFYLSRMADRYVTVKGLSEKDVSADLAVWTIKLAATGDVLSEVQAKTEADKKVLLDFLKAQEVSDSEIVDNQLNVIDLMAQEYRSERADRSRFIVNYSVTVRSNDVAKINSVSQKTGELVKSGLVLADNSGPTFIFTKLNEIKPEMIADATKNARASAEQFAKDSGSNVGGIRRASQGMFSIEARDGSSMDSQEGYSPAPNRSQIEKKVRVVSTIDYYLVN